MNDIDRLRDYTVLPDQLLQDLPKETIAEAARILAMNVAHYQSQYGELPLPESMQVQLASGKGELTDVVAKLTADGLQTLAGVLALVMGLEDDAAPGVH